MILKIQSGKGWRYLEGVSEFGSQDFEKSTIRPKLIFEEIIINHHHLQNDEIVPDKTNMGFPMKHIWFKNKSSEIKQYLVDSETYLMSDEGKTIERIN